MLTLERKGTVTKSLLFVNLSSSRGPGAVREAGVQCCSVEKALTSTAEHMRALHQVLLLRPKMCTLVRDTCQTLQRWVSAAAVQAKLAPGVGEELGSSW